MPVRSLPTYFGRSLYNFPGFRFDVDDPGNGQHTDKDANAGGNSGKPNQEELDRQFAERAKRAQEAERKRILESMGAKDEDELKAIIEAKKKADEAAKTELQKQADKVKETEDKLTKLEAENSAKLAEMQKRLLDSEIKLLAGKPVTDKDGKVVRAAFRPEAIEAVLLLIDRKQIADKEGKYEGIDKALEALAKSNAYMLEVSSNGDKRQKQNGSPADPTKKPKSSGDEPEEELMFRSL
jgi:hypothetical protein